MRALQPSLPIVIASGQGEGSLQDRFGRLGRVAILVKPFTSAELEAAFRTSGIGLARDNG